MIFRPAPTESRISGKEGMLTDVWSFFFKSLEAGKRNNLGTGQVDAATALLNLDNIIGLGTLILEPTSTSNFYAFTGQIDGQKILVYNNGTAVITINQVTSTISSNKGLTIQWDKTLNKWIEA